MFSHKQERGSARRGIEARQKARESLTPKIETQSSFQAQSQDQKQPTLKVTPDKTVQNKKSMDRDF